MRHVLGAVAIAGSVAAGGLGWSVPAYARATPDSFADLIEHVAPAVVQITATESASSADVAEGVPGLPLDQIPEPFRQFFEQLPRQGRPGGKGAPHPSQQSLGSGFIISTDGIIVTNNHVVGDAKKLDVALQDGTHYPAKLLGKDDKTDLAVLRIDAGRTLPTVPWGNSNDLRVGDWVIAVGNPFGFSGSATAGIVSSLGRNIGAGPYDDFIQIDAPINRGNSGGPLFNMSGEVVGVNTAIYSPNGGSIGIGFAIPSTVAEKVVAQLENKGKVERGWLGVSIQQVTPDVAESLGLDHASGALVANVLPDTPAAAAGMKQGDVIVAFNGKEVTTPRELSLMAANASIGSKSTLTVLRGDRKVDVDVKVAEMPQQVASNDEGESPQSSEHHQGVELGALGLTLAPLNESERNRLGLPANAKGALVTAVNSDADAAEKGLQPDDLITRINQQAVKGPEDVEKAVSEAQRAKRRSVLLLIERNGEQRFVPVQLSQA